MTKNAVKHDDGKPMVELLSSAALLEIAKVMTFGASKYDAHNWRKGFNWSRLIGAAQRHLLAFNDGEDLDSETGLKHLAHLGCCVMFLLEHQIKELGEDDRYKGENNVSNPITISPGTITTIDPDAPAGGVQHRVKLDKRSQA